jgi:SAM-dependent methyltransferase
VVETSAGPQLVKLRGAAQGTGPLVAEIVVGSLAEVIGLRVPARSLVTLPAEIETADWDDELADLLAASVGVNLGFEFLADSHELTTAEVDRVPARDKAAILWLDRLVLNPDRTAANPNILWSAGGTWLIDHGAALGFQYAWSRVTESAPREAALMPDAHLLESAVPHEDLVAIDAELAPRVTREALEDAVGAVPDDFLRSLVKEGAAAATLARRRAAYVAFLWKRLKAPRPFVIARPLPARRRSVPPPWLRQADKSADTARSYDAVAGEYAHRIHGELAHKPLDRELLDRFGDALRGRGPVRDIGCGPGHVTRHLHERGVEVAGIDLSKGMVERARALNPGIAFAVGDMARLDVPDESWTAIVLFYSVIHVPRPSVPAVLGELRRTLAAGGLLFLAFHIGTETLHLDEWWGHDVSVDFHFYTIAEMAGFLTAAGFVIDEIREREPYPDVEHQSRRAYILARKP